MLSPDALEADIFHHLMDTSALEDLHANLLSSLQRSGWTERVRTLSLELLRAGRCDHFDDVLDAVVAIAEGKTHPAVHLPEDTANGELHDPDVEAFFENFDVKIPASVVEQGVKAIKEALRPIAVLEDDGEDGEPVQQQAKKEAVKARDSTAPRKNGDAGPAKKAVKDKKPKTWAKDVKTSS
jgi:hypothetical protein